MGQVSLGGRAMLSIVRDRARKMDTPTHVDGSAEMGSLSVVLIFLLWSWFGRLYVCLTVLKETWRHWSPTIKCFELPVANEKKKKMLPLSG